MRTVAIVNQKGGSGKTTTAVNLAAALGERDRKVLVIDLDPQASATAWLGISNAGRGLLDVFVGNTSVMDIMSVTGILNVSAVPASTWLISAEKALASEVGAETILRKQIEKLPRNWDFVLLDCPPTLGVLTVNALAATREVLIPVEAHVMALTGVVRLLETVNVVKDRLNPHLEISGILACRVDGRTRHAQDVVGELRKRFGPQVYKTVVRENVRLAEAFSFGKPISTYDPRSAGAEDYARLAAEVMKRGEK